MSALADMILAELQRHEAQPSFNLRCKCGHIERTVSEIGDFERHVSVEMAAALSAAGLAIAAPEPPSTAYATAAVEDAQSDSELPEDERHTAWCRGGHDARCRRGRMTGTEK